MGMLLSQNNPKSILAQCGHCVLNINILIVSWGAEVFGVDNIKQWGNFVREWERYELLNPMNNQLFKHIIYIFDVI